MTVDDKFELKNTRANDDERWRHMNINLDVS